MDQSSERPSYEPDDAPSFATEPAAKLSSLQRLTKAFFSPGEVFEDIHIKPTWILALVAMMIVTVAAQAIVLPHMDNEGTLRARLGDRVDELSDEQIDDMLAGGEKVARFVPVITAVVVPIMWAILAGIFFLTLKLVGSDVDYPRTLSAALHAYWPPSVVASLLVALLIQRVDKITEQDLPNLVKSHLGILLPPDAPGWLSGVASTFSVFNVWTLALLIIGFKIVGRISTSRAAVAVAIPWVVWLMAKAGLGVLQSMMS